MGGSRGPADRIEIDIVLTVLKVLTVLRVLGARVPVLKVLVLQVLGY
jgi:hypothetical protein